MSDDSEKPKSTVASRRSHVDTNPNAQIASKLKAYYTSVEQEPIPEVFLDLLERLESVEKAQKP